MTVLVFDIEADNLLPNLTKCHCLAIKEMTNDGIELYANVGGYRPITEGLSRLTGADILVAHNGIGYDCPALVQLYGDLADFTRPEIYDTLVASRFYHQEKRGHSLRALGEELGFEKSSHDDFTTFSEDMAAYCKRDVEVTAKIFEQLWTGEITPALALEFRFASIMAMQEQHGFRLDVKKAQALESEFRQEQFDIERELQEHWEPKVIERYSEKTGKRLKDKVEVFNPGSGKQIAERLTEQYGWKPKRYTPAGSPKVDEAVLNTLKYPEAKSLARYRRLQKLLGQLSDGDNGWLRHERDGYVHGSVNTIGTQTHRLSHFSPNMGQVDKKEPRMREVWLPDVGHVLVGVDADAIELCCLASWLYKYDDGEYQEALLHGTKEEGTDVHSRTMRLLEFPERDAAKTAVYATLYGAGNRKLAQISREAGGPIKDGAEIRRRINTGIKGFGELSKAISKRADKGWFKALDGRRIKVDSEHRCLNYLLQSTAAIAMKKALEIFHFDNAPAAGFICSTSTVNHASTRHYCYVANVHDEIQMTAHADNAEEIGKLMAQSITDAGVALGMKCPLSGSVQIGKNWKETH